MKHCTGSTYKISISFFWIFVLRMRMYPVFVLSLILPTYNEAENLPQLLPALCTALEGIPHEIIIVDDDSPDKTWKIARNLAWKNPDIHVVRRVGRYGLSSAVMEGFLASKGTVLAVMDADGQHDLTLLSTLYGSVHRDSGMAIGSRYMQGGSVGQWDERRHALSRLATRMAIRLCKVEATDPMSGFFAIDRLLFESVLPALNPKGFKILLDLLVHVPRSTRVREFPFRFGVRTHGESKLSRRVQVEFLEYLYDVTLGTYIPLTFIKYCLVGTVGVLVNLAVYLAVSRLFLSGPQTTLQGFSLALLAGMETAIIFNFFLNNAWTFSRMKLRGLQAVSGLVTFNIACLFGAFADYAVSAFFFTRGFPEILSVILGAGVGVIWNYTMNRLFTWKT
ncbi:MAG: Dolichol monophosphate mannose synthase [Candidatus Peribacteria bacterium]|nr:Dolichol monophosphate mannose synthase [Candidatus Peribacteria bacterium]